MRNRRLYGPTAGPPSVLQPRMFGMVHGTVDAAQVDLNTRGWNRMHEEARRLRVPIVGDGAGYRIKPTSAAQVPELIDGSQLLDMHVISEEARSSIIKTNNPKEILIKGCTFEYDDLVAWSTSTEAAIYTWAEWSAEFLGNPTNSLALSNGRDFSAAIQGSYGANCVIEDNLFTGQDTYQGLMWCGIGHYPTFANQRSGGDGTATFRRNEFRNYFMGHLGTVGSGKFYDERDSGYWGQYPDGPPRHMYYFSAHAYDGTSLLDEKVHVRGAVSTSRMHPGTTGATGGDFIVISSKGLGDDCIIEDCVVNGSIGLAVHQGVTLRNCVIDQRDNWLDVQAVPDGFATDKGLWFGVHFWGLIDALTYWGIDPEADPCGIDCIVEGLTIHSWPYATPVYADGRPKGWGDFGDNTDHGSGPGAGFEGLIVRDCLIYLPPKATYDTTKVAGRNCVMGTEAKPLRFVRNDETVDWPNAMKLLTLQSDTVGLPNSGYAEVNAPEGSLAGSPPIIYSSGSGTGTVAVNTSTDPGW